VERYLTWGLAGGLLVLAIVFFIVGLRRRLERGRPARFHFGLGLVDIIEGFTGRELSQRTQGMIFAVAVGIGVLAFLVGLALLLLRRGGLS
jgi:hypothetical protein